MRGEAAGPGFWARRRAAVAAEARDAEAVREADAARDPSEEAAPDERSEAEVLAALGLPDPDALRPGDDFAAFMSRAVPEALRRRALRRLWSSRPVLANLDGLVDYDDDYTGGGVASGALPSVYRIGRGLLDRAERLAEEAAEEKAPSPPDAEPPVTAAAEPQRTEGRPRSRAAGDPVCTEAPDAAEAAPPQRTAALPPGPAADGPVHEAPATLIAAAPRRRMRFEFA